MNLMCRNVQQYFEVQWMSAGTGHTYLLWMYLLRLIIWTVFQWQWSSLSLFLLCDQQNQMCGAQALSQMNMAFKSQPSAPLLCFLTNYSERWKCMRKFWGSILVLRGVNQKSYVGAYMSAISYKITQCWQFSGNDQWNSGSLLHL